MTIPPLSKPSHHHHRSSRGRDFSRSPLSFASFARALFLAVLCGAPWAFGAVQPWAWATILAASLGALVLWSVGCARRGVLRICWSPLYWPFLVFLVLAAAQYFTGLTADHVATREALLKIVTNLIVFFLAGQLLNAQPENGRALVWLGRLVSLLAIALCSLGFAQLLWGPPRVIYWTFPVVGWPFGPYVNHNNYAGLMEMLLPISVAYIFSRPSRSALPWLLWVGAILVVISLWTSGSRAAALVVLVEGAVWVGILSRRPRGVHPQLFVALLVAVLISVAGFSWLVGTGKVEGRSWSVFDTNQSVEAKLGDRVRVGIDTLRMAIHHPWFGVGVGSFQSTFPKYLTFSTDLIWGHAHNDFLEGVAEMGLPGAVLIGVALVIFFRKAFRHVEDRLRYEWGWIQMGATVGVVGLLCHSLVDFNLRVPANAAWFVVCLAIATHSRPSAGVLRMDRGEANTL